MAKTPGTAVVSKEDVIKKQLAQTAATTAPTSGDIIKLTKAKTFKMPDGTEAAGPLSVVVLGYIARNIYFDKPYRDGEVSPPACYAIDQIIENMAPSAKAPAKQNDTCKGCPQNEFGTKGAGKACQNQRILVVTAPTADGSAAKYKIVVSPTAAKFWDAYVKMLSTKYGKVPWQMVTEIYFDEKSEYQSLRFGNPSENPFEDSSFAQLAEVEEMLRSEPDVSGYEPPKKRAGK